MGGAHPTELPGGCIQGGDALRRKDSAHHRRDPARQLRSRQRMEVDGFFCVQKPVKEKSIRNAYIVLYSMRITVKPFLNPAGILEEKDEPDPIDYYAE